MEIESGTARKSEAGRRSKPLSKRVFCVLLVCLACFSISLSCIGQENQGVEEPLADAASWVTANFTKTEVRDAQSTTAANPNASDQAKAKPEKKKKFGGRGAFVVAPLPISSPAIGSGIVPVLGYIFRLVAFGGVGGTIPAGSQLLQRVQTGHFLPSGGGGLRFELSKKYRVNLRADIAQGRDGHTFGMGVGEAF